MHTSTGFGPEGTNVGLDFDQSPEKCIEDCLVCYQSCSQLIPHCLSMGRDHASPEHIGLLQCCATICETAARFMMFKSDFHRETCRLCAQVCRQCAEECEDMSEDDAMMRECVEACLACAESCEMMASH